jgi:hypothetical protein
MGRGTDIIGTIWAVNEPQLDSVVYLGSVLAPFIDNDWNCGYLFMDTVE